MDARSKIRSVRRLAPVVLLLGLATAAAAAAQPLGDLTEFSFPEQSRPVSIAAGPDGRLWVTEGNGWLARVTTDGVVEQQSLPPWITEMPPSPGPIAAGPDGNLWIGDPACCAASDGIDWIERMATDGTGTPFAVPTSRAGVSSIAAGADGNLWFTEELGNQIGRITTGGQIVEFADGLTPGSWPQGISAGPDGNLWFAENATNKIGRITPDGTITEFSNGITGSSGLEETAPGPDGNVWFTNGNGSVGKITRAGAATEFPTPTSSSGPVAIAPGPDGNVRSTENSADRVECVTPCGTITE
jgi:virginiamycin B lyase